ncbi:MAG TPA: hypothetical protein VLA33_09115 [Gemmatimonadota bacterium]|nr:hypothetical protein [Gemmatimonadota bacterium]
MARMSKQTSGRHGARIGVRASSAGATLCGMMAAIVAAGCLNTQSTAFQEQPAPLTSPADACRAAAAAEGFTVIEVTDLREVSEGYWEANFVIQDPELRNLLGCRHSISGGFTEVVRLDE